MKSNNIKSFRNKFIFKNFQLKLYKKQICIFIFNYNSNFYGVIDNIKYILLLNKKIKIIESKEQI